MRFLANWTTNQEEAEQTLAQHQGRVAVDIETVSLENTLPVGIGLAINDSQAYYFYDVQDELLKQAVGRSELVLVHNAKFDIPLLRKMGYQVNAFDDTHALAYSNGLMDRSLVHLSETVLLRDCSSVKSIWRGDKTGNIGIDHVALGQICMVHARNCYMLWDKLGKPDLYRDLDRPYLDCIMEMEYWGLAIDQHALTVVDHETTMEAKAVEQELYQTLGQINLASNPQVAKALQTRGVLGTRKTKAGADSVSDESLAPLHNPIADKILEYRKLMKTITTYVPAFRSVDSQGRIHTQFGYAETGRLTSSGPNLQNISRNALRGCIRASSGYTLLSLDASQLEMRVVAILSQDPLLMEALASEDLHLATAIRVFGYTSNVELMTQRRYDAKQINFAILYGATDKKIAEMTGHPLEVAQDLLRSYFATYTVLETWMKGKVREAKRAGFVTNIFGRIRPLPDLASGLWYLREKGEREVVNTLVQGTASDVIKLQQLYLKSIVSPDVRFILQVHDEVLMEVPEGIVEHTVACCGELALAFPEYPCTLKMGQNYGGLSSHVPTLQ